MIQRVLDQIKYKGNHRQPAKAQCNTCSLMLVERPCPACIVFLVKLSCTQFGSCGLVCFTSSLFMYLNGV